MSTPERGQVGKAEPAALTEVVPSLALAPDYPALRRYLGYPGASTPGPKLALELERIVGGAWASLEPRGAYRVLAVHSSSRSAVTAGGQTLTGQVAGFIGDVEWIGVFVVTVGGAITRLSAEACHAGNALAGLALDALGSWAAEASTDALMRHLESRVGPDDALSVRYSPGYCGMNLEEQRTLFELVDAAAVGVSLTPSCLMQPEKSVSGIVGIGPHSVVSPRRSPCDGCPALGCHMRRGAGCP